VYCLVEHDPLRCTYSLPAVLGGLPGGLPWRYLHPAPLSDVVIKARSGSGIELYNRSHIVAHSHAISAALLRGAKARQSDTDGNEGLQNWLSAKISEASADWLCFERGFRRISVASPSCGCPNFKVQDVCPTKDRAGPDRKPKSTLVRGAVATAVRRVAKNERV